jgi:hypothetical protein
VATVAVVVDQATAVVVVGQDAPVVAVVVDQVAAVVVDGSARYYSHSVP